MVCSAFRSTATSVGSMGGTRSSAAPAAALPAGGARRSPPVGVERDRPPSRARKRLGLVQRLELEPGDLRARARSSRAQRSVGVRASGPAAPARGPPSPPGRWAPSGRCPSADTERLPLSGPSTARVRSVGGAAGTDAVGGRAAPSAPGASAWPERSRSSSAVPVTSACPRRIPGYEQLHPDRRAHDLCDVEGGHRRSRAFTGSCVRRRRASTGRSTSALSSGPVRAHAAAPSPGGRPTSRFP